MRKIKFRLFDSQTKEVLYKISDHWTYWEDDNTLSGNQDYLVLEQYTGLKDKGGKEIYEGDILHFDDDPHNSNDVVTFEDGSFYIGNSYLGEWINYMTTIGNIHENQELLATDI